jgi:alpha-1,6-mannosyltransferase
MKTMHITNAYHPASGGIRTFYRQLLYAAEDHQRYVRLIVPSDTTHAEDINAYARIYHIKAPRSPFFDRRYRILLPHSWMMPNRNAIRDIMISEQPELVEIADKYALCFLAGFLRKGWIKGVKRPVVIGMSCERMDDNVAAFITRSEAGQRLAQWYMRAIYIRLFDSFIAVSQYTADEIRAFENSSNKKVHVAMMGVEADLFHPRNRDNALRERVLKEAGGTGNSIGLLYAGRVSHEKNVGLLANMMEQLRRSSYLDYRLIVVGSGPLVGWMQEENLRRADGHILCIQHIQDRTELARFCASMDIFVHPNPKEPFGIAPLEAMASGIPVVAPHSGGVLSYANESNAWLAEPIGDAFAQAVKDILNNPFKRTSRIYHARMTAKNLAWSKSIEHLFSLYDQILLRNKFQY